MATPSVSFSAVLRAIQTNIVSVTGMPEDCVLFSGKRGPNPKAQMDPFGRLIFIRPQGFTPVQPKVDGEGRADPDMERRVDVNLAIWRQLDPADEDEIKLMETYGYFDLEKQVMDAIQTRTLIYPDNENNAIGLNVRCLGGSAPLVGEKDQRGWMDGTITFSLEWMMDIDPTVL